MSNLTNPNASAEAKALMEFLESIHGKYILSAQHTGTRDPIELHEIQNRTGKLPAIGGFELGGYSPNVNFVDTDRIAIGEVMGNCNTIDTAIEWAKKGGIVTYTYHWYSPMGGRNKSFYTQYTDFDLEKAMAGNCPEYTAILRDLDLLADNLKRLRDLHIPVLWRPLHEAEGGWFWWGAKGPEPCKKLWRLMYDRFTQYHHMDNLIWVWNSPDPAWYPGDDCVDIISRDLYPMEEDTACKKEFDELLAVSKNKMRAWAECGIPSTPDLLFKEGANWLWVMAWCFGSVLSEDAPSEESNQDQKDWWHKLKPTLGDRLCRFYADPRVLCLGDCHF